MTPDQVMAARNLLGWSRVRLEAMSGASAGTVRTYERDGRLTRAISGPSGPAQLAAISAALEAVGIVLIKENGGAAGVRLQRRSVTIHAAQGSLAPSGSVTPGQLKAAREMLGWGIQKLAGRSRTAVHLIRTYERSGRVAATYGWMMPADPLAAIRATFEEAGVEFVEESEAGPGVRLQKPAGAE